MLSTTVATWITVGILKSPMPRRAAPIATSGELERKAGTNQVRYSDPASGRDGVGASQRQ